jgi:GTPase SAR1 family protein
MLGRCLFGHNEMDRWQVMMYILGMPGTGKSTFLNHVLKRIYQETEIGILDNNIEEQFGLNNIIRTGEKFITIGVELDNTFKLKRTDFLKMVSGDDLMIAVKGKTGFTYLWPSHIVCVGNKIFGFEDHKGELARRIIPFMYDYKVKNNDTDLYLDEKLFQELPNIIQKITKAYLWAAQKYGTKNIWCVLPKYFHETKIRISEQTNALQGFLYSNEITFSKDEYCLESVFRQRFMEYCKSRGMRIPKLTNEMYTSVLQDITDDKGYPVHFKSHSTQIYPRKGGFIRKNEAFLFGFDVINRDSFNFTPGAAKEGDDKTL